ncbi:Metallophosphoesterase [Elusimicrobium minutum Pei191]|uniref:Metallophosphoesterase n=1 Tax=Elusimicrobium minutum (strain Pei191) TaxID=445932 RepID=B2KBE8_ELUMP|nr:metallophosphoesterase family protein [Elusimicrobium minutum]ACC97970.1 Metallophosphoesterase [Elusimicrobium minutum Pei191]
MKYGVFSDVHANLPALEAVLAEFDKAGIDHFICCGDIIGYGPHAEACASAVRKLPNLIAVMGNHDKALSDPDILQFFSQESVMPIVDANMYLSNQNILFLSELPNVYLSETFSLVHGTFSDPFKEYLLTPAQFKLNKDEFPGSYCFIGHSHIPFIMCGHDEQHVSVELFPKEEVTIKFDPKKKYFINPGSVGQPRDHNPLASAGIFDSDNNTFKLIRVAYDIKKVQEDMKKKGFSERLMNRLGKGV